MSLPLQPSLTPWPLWLHRLAIVAALILSIVIVGVVWGTARRPPPKIVLSGAGHDMEYPRAVERLVSQAQHQVSLMMYVMQLDGDGPVARLAQVLADAAGRGVIVRVVLDRGLHYKKDLEDNKNEKAEQWLRAHGIHVVLDELETITHAKTLVVDHRWVIVGSHNWTYSAFVKNREVSVVMDDEQMATTLEMWFKKIPGWE